MAEKKDLNRQARRTVSLTVAFVAGLVFGIILLAGGDWIPGAVIVAATLIGLAVQIPVIAKLCSARPATHPPGSKPTS